MFSVSIAIAVAPTTATTTRLLARWSAARAIVIATPVRTPPAPPCRPTPIANPQNEKPKLRTIRGRIARAQSANSLTTTILYSTALKRSLTAPTCTNVSRAGKRYPRPLSNKPPPAAHQQPSLGFESPRGRPDPKVVPTRSGRPVPILRDSGWTSPTSRSNFAPR